MPKAAKKAPKAASTRAKKTKAKAPEKASSKAKKARPASADVSVQLEQLRKEIAALTERLATVEATLQVAPVDAAADTPSAKPKSTADDPVALLRKLLANALALAAEPMPADVDEAETLFSRFAELIHSDRKGTPLLDRNLQNYTWLQLRKNVLIYLKNANDPSSYTVTRREPMKFGPGEERARFFLKAATRMPTPVSFRRDAEDGDRWRIEASSL